MTVGVTPVIAPLRNNAPSAGVFLTPMYMQAFAPSGFYQLDEVWLLFRRRAAKGTGGGGNELQPWRLS